MLRIIGPVIYLVMAVKISLSDLQSRLIKNRDLLIFLILTMSIHVWGYGLEDLKSLAYVSLVCLVLHLLFLGKIGAGDLKLFWVVSFWTTGLSQWLSGMSLAWIIGGVFAIVFSIYTHLRGARFFSIPFAPFIFLAFIPVI
jgi:hypothetical protein